MSRLSLALKIEIIYNLIVAKLNLTFYPFKKLSPKLISNSSLRDNLNTKEVELIKTIRKGITRISKRFPFEVSCYPQAIAAKKMLNRRHLKSTLYLGARKNANGQMEGHAWLRCSDYNVTGKLNYKTYTIINSYT